MLINRLPARQCPSPRNRPHFSKFPRHAAPPVPAHNCSSPALHPSPRATPPRPPRRGAGNSGSASWCARAPASPRGQWRAWGRWAVSLLSVWCVGAEVGGSVLGEVRLREMGGGRRGDGKKGGGLHCRARRRGRRHGGLRSGREGELGVDLWRGWRLWFTGLGSYGESEGKRAVVPGKLGSLL